MVVDEEQRFGVSHKEKLKMIKENVDVLTLTATPIPRTLHMSLVGIRDISTIEEPPEDRLPVQTYVMEHDDDVLKDAIAREIARGGQVFYLYNRVKSIHTKAEQIRKIIPEARIAVAHGQMNSTELEDTILDFIEFRFDILLCTTIIESGIDMPNVNTIIIEDGDRFGLAQLYQLRGRVGRSNRLAYAYITFKKDKVLTEIAQKRLSAIKEFTEFGSGFKIAMRDLEIRGAGSLIGNKQHGHIETVGYEMYCMLLEESVRDLKGESGVKEEAETSIDINISAYIDNNYINHEEQKIEMYKKIASIADEQDALDIQDELLDRYGDIPEAVSNLIQISLIKTMMKKSKIISLQDKKDFVISYLIDLKKLNLEMIFHLVGKYKNKLMFSAANNPYLSYKTKGIEKKDLLKNIKIILQDINNLQIEL
jgi:transcription-repair coupling factor (superfamily II helicase)